MRSDRFPIIVGSTVDGMDCSGEDIRSRRDSDWDPECKASALGHHSFCLSLKGRGENLKTSDNGNLSSGKTSAETLVSLKIEKSSNLGFPPCPGQFSSFTLLCWLHSKLSQQSREMCHPYELDLEGKTSWNGWCLNYNLIEGDRREYVWRSNKRPQQCGIHFLGLWLTDRSCKASQGRLSILSPDYAVMKEVGPCCPRSGKRYLLKLEGKGHLGKEQWTRGPDFYSWLFY